MSEDADVKDLLGLRVLFLAAVVTGALVVVLVLVRTVTSGASLLMSALPLLLVVAMMLLVCALVLGASSTQRSRGRLAASGRWALRTTGAGALRASGAAVRGGLAGTRATVGLGVSVGWRTQVAVRRFRIRQLDGSLVACAQLGDLVGDEIRQGDVLRLQGSRRRDGLLMVTTAEVLAAPAGPVMSIVTTRRASRFRTLTVLDRVAGAAGVLLLLGVALVVVQVLR